MSPPRREINGPRPIPLRINRDSHIIQKPSSSYSNSPPNSSMSGLAAAKKQQNRKAESLQQNPTIIYARSPKIIHTKPRDFMALVQKLTGLSSSDKEINSLLSKEANKNHESKVQDNESSSVSYENSGGGGIKFMSSSSLSPAFNALPNQFLIDMPLFTPNSTGFFFSPRSLYRYSDTVLFPSPNMGKSMTETMK